MLRLPHVNVCAGHAVVPATFHEILRRHPRVHVSARCAEAVEWLHSRLGLNDASPFWYVSAFSDELNVYCEPPEFLASEHRPAFEPVAFYGSLDDDEEPTAPTRCARPMNDGRLRHAYVSFGTMVMDYRQKEALAALRPIADALSRRGVATTISLGGATVSESDRVALDRPGIIIASYVDQARALSTSDVFGTHHGLNSTHEGSGTACQ